MNDWQMDKVLIEAEPEPVAIDFTKTAILVVDMQNAFVSQGGYFDAVGFDISATEKIVLPCQKVIGAGRQKGIKIVYLQMGCDQDISGKKSAESPSFYKSRIPTLLEQRPELKDKLYLDGTWGAEIIAELKPQPQDIIIRKQKHDAFIGTDLEYNLRTLGVKFLIFLGTATNICVESTLRHAFFLDYFCILVSDAVSQMGSSLTQQATMLNVQSTFGWVTKAGNLLLAIRNGSVKSPK